MIAQYYYSTQTAPVTHQVNTAATSGVMMMMMTLVLIQYCVVEKKKEKKKSTVSVIWRLVSECSCCF